MVWCSADRGIKTRQSATELASTEDVAKIFDICSNVICRGIVCRVVNRK